MLWDLDRNWPSEATIKASPGAGFRGAEKTGKQHASAWCFPVFSAFSGYKFQNQTTTFSGRFRRANPVIALSHHILFLLHVFWSFSGPPENFLVFSGPFWCPLPRLGSHCGYDGEEYISYV